MLRALQKPLDGLESGQSVCRGGARDVECPWGVQPCSDCCETYFILEAATGPQAKLVSALAQVDDAAVTAAVRAGADVNACLFCGDADHEVTSAGAAGQPCVHAHIDSCRRAHNPELRVCVSACDPCMLATPTRDPSPHRSYGA